MVNAAAAFTPVVCLLALLVVMDSFKLVPMRATTVYAISPALTFAPAPPPG
jgi:hypothetical protein